MELASHRLPRALLIHGSAEVRKFVAQHLKGRYELETARTARTALKSIASHPPDVILCEARILAAKSFQLLHHVRGEANGAEAPVVMLYGEDGEQCRAAALAAGVDDLLREPFDEVELLARLDVNVRAATSRREAETEFREHEEWLRAALTASGAGVYRWDYRTGRSVWDASLDALMGFPLGHTLETHEEFLSLLHPDDRPEVDRRCRLCLSSGANFDMEYRLGRGDGTYVWIHDRAKTVRDASGKPIYLLGACVDVTARKLLELRSKFISELDESLRLLSDPDEITTTASRLLGTYLGADRCAFAEVHADENTFDVFGEFSPNVPSMRGRYKFTEYGREVSAAMRANRPFVVHDIDTHQPPLEDLTVPRATQVYAGICVPLHKNGRFVGAMAAHQRHPRQWTQDEVELVQTVADRCWESLERARVMRSLAQSEARYREMTNAIPIDFCNDRWYEYTGSPRDAAGDDMWRPYIHPDDAGRMVAAWLEAVKTGDSYQLELRLKEAATGQYRWFLSRAVRLHHANPESVRWFGTSADIHDLKVAQQQLRAHQERLNAIIEATPECVSVISRDGALLQINSSGLEVIQAATEDEVRGKSALELVVPEHRQKWIENHERVCLGENLRWEFEIIGLQGRRRWLESHAVPVTVTEGGQAHLAITRDITSRRQFELERDQLLAAERTARAEAENTGRLKDEFLATLSHELRTPLNAILGYATLIRMSPMTEAERDEALETIERNARLQTQLIDDLLDMNAIISGKVRLDVQTLTLPDVIEAAVDAVRPDADAKGVRLDTVIDPMAGPVRGDPARLQQIFWNLLANSIKFTPRGGSVQIALESAGSQIEVTVTDTGEGISPDFLPHVFDRFRQADSSTTRKYGGLGLGLSIVKHLVELHGGAVRAHSAGRGQGATFVASFPLAAVLDERDVARRVRAETVKPAAAYEPVDLSGIDVLAVDDDPDACTLVKRVLEGCRANVETASSARAAIELMRERRFDVLVSDIGMPMEDGYDLMRTLRSLQGAAEAPHAIALTAFARPEDRQRAALAGYHRHVAKPVEAGELIAIVANLTGRAS
jgi:PAS domain S-box-containing protein